MWGQEGVRWDRSVLAWVTLQRPLFSPVYSSFRVQHMDLSNSVINVSNLHGILSECSKLQNLSLEGLQLSDPIVKWVAPEVCCKDSGVCVTTKSLCMYPDIADNQNRPGFSRQQTFEGWAYSMCEGEKGDHQSVVHAPFMGETDNYKAECLFDELLAMWQYSGGTN